MVSKNLNYSVFCPSLSLCQRQFQVSSGVSWYLFAWVEEGKITRCNPSTVAICIWSMFSWQVKVNTICKLAMDMWFFCQYSIKWWCRWAVTVRGENWTFFPLCTKLCQHRSLKYVILKLNLLWELRSKYALNMAGNLIAFWIVTFKMF